MEKYSSPKEILDFIDTVMEGNCHYDKRIEQLNRETKNLCGMEPHILDIPVRSRPGLSGKIIILIKRFFRKFTRWYVKPAFDYQNEINDKEKHILHSVSSIMEDLYTAFQDIRNELNEYRRIADDRFLQLQEDTISILNEYGKRLEKICEEQTHYQTEYDQQLKKFISENESVDKKLEEYKNIFSELQQKVNKSQEFYQQEEQNHHTIYEELRDCIFELQRTSELSLSQKEKIESDVSHMQDLILPLKSEIDLISKKVTELEQIQQNDNNRSLLEELKSQNCIYDMRVRRVERKLNASLNSKTNFKGGKGSTQLPPVPAAEELDYFLFENKYRGTLEDIKKRQEIYIDIFRGASHVIDLGCGRGEFVELLKENGIDAEGIDLSEDNVQSCQERQLPVYKDGIFEYLSAAEDSSLGGIFCSQVVEHFTTEQLLTFIQLAYKKLKPNAPIVIETINPKNIVAVSNWFYMDLTHVRPVHPETLKFVLESYGYYVKETNYLHPDSQAMMPKLKNPEEGEFNAKLDHLNECLFGPQDYAVVAYKMSGIEG